MHLPVKSKTLDEACDMEMTTGDGDEQDPSREKFYCSICGKHYDRSFEQVHVRMHSGEEKFNCRICNKVFPNDESLKMHMNAHQDARVVSVKLDFLVREKVLLIDGIFLKKKTLDQNQSRNEKYKIAVWVSVLWKRICSTTRKSQTRTSSHR